MRRDLIEAINEAKDIYCDRIRLSKIVDSFSEILLKNLTSSEERVKNFITNNNYDSFCRIKTKSKRYQYGIRKDKCYNYKFGNCIRFTLVALDNIDTRNDYELVYLEIYNRGEPGLYDYMKVEDIALYELLLKEF